MSSITGTTIIAGGAVGNITVSDGSFGGSMGWAQFVQQAVGQLDLTGPLNIHIIGPAANFVSAGSVGNITAQGDISGNVITATTGNIGNLTSQEGQIAFDTVTAQGSIGNISATAQDASVAFDSAGNLIVASATNITESGLVLHASASAIVGDTFTATTGSIGNITAAAANVGSGGSVSVLGITAAVSSSGIDHTVFTAAAGIGSVTASSAGHGNTDYGIVHSTFTVTGAVPLGGT